MQSKFALYKNDSYWHKWKKHPFIRGFLYLFLGIILYALMVGNVVPNVVDVSIGSVAEEDIRSPISMVDEQATEEAREQAATDVTPVYTQDNSITNNQINQLNRLFSHMRETITNTNLTNDEKVDELAQILSPFALGEDEYTVIINTSLEDIDMMTALTRDTVSRIMYQGVRNEGGGLREARNEVAESLVFSTLNTDLRGISREIARGMIIPNHIFDQERMELLREEAKDQVDVIEILEGEILVRQGEIIDAEIFATLRGVGLLSESNNWYPFIGLGLFILLLLSLLGIYISSSELPIRKNNTQFLMYILIFLLNVLVLKVISIGQGLEYTGVALMAPVAFGTMIIAMLLHQRLAVFSSFLFGLIAAVILNAETSSYFDFQYAFVTMFGGLAGAFFLGNATRKRKILLAGFVVSGVTMLAAAITLMLGNVNLNLFELSLYMFFAFLSGIVACIFTVGLMPFFEASFGILSSMKLIELSNPNQKLLRKILVDAPGTYHHSVMVANLAEAATEAIGGNGLLARVASYYHDVGKTKRPHFFVENQMNIDNPHNKIAPQLSATIIIAHVKDSKKMLQDEGLPKAIVDIAEQHHGTSLIKYFYHQAQKESDKEINKSDFCYPGPKPQFKESAVVKIADSVEAAVRTLSKPSPERIEHLVRGLIQDNLEHGQFNECDLTLKDLDIIAKSICESLKGTFHSRIEYPTVEELKKDKRQIKKKQQNRDGQKEDEDDHNVTI